MMIRIRQQYLSSPVLMHGGITEMILEVISNNPDEVLVAIMLFLFINTDKKGEYSWHMHM